jgi:hypothetical protein
MEMAKIKALSPLGLEGKVNVHQNIKTNPQLFFDPVFAYLKDIAFECMFCPGKSAWQHI